MDGTAGTLKTGKMTVRENAATTLLSPKENTRGPTPYGRDQRFRGLVVPNTRQ